MRFPRYIEKKAEEVIESFENGDVKPKKTKKYNYLVLDVGKRYRLINKGKGWELMSHEEYNKKIDK